MVSIARPPTLTDAVVDHFRTAIVRGDFVPGAPLHEVELSKTLNVSRGTIREALRKLQDEGLVTIAPHRGAVVIQLDAGQVREIYTLRALLESHAVRLAMEQGAFTQERIAKLEQLVQMLGQLEEKGNVFEILKTDMEIHYLICECSGHSLLLDAIRNLQTQVRQFILTTKVFRSDLVTDEVSHRVILDVIKTGTPERAERVMWEHITQAGQSLLQSMGKGAQTG
jgi:DNA-binding GntR family transcriptional regulator